jgi:hypothetical protein
MTSEHNPWSSFVTGLTVNRYRSTARVTVAPTNHSTIFFTARRDAVLGERMLKPGAVE